jgi:hypothetical protein
VALLELRAEQMAAEPERRSWTERVRSLTRPRPSHARLRGQTP